MTLMTNPTWVQLHFRGRGSDTVTLNSTTFTYNLDTNWTQSVDTTFRVRFEIEETATATQSNDLAPQLEYNLGGAGWNPVTTTSSVVKAVVSGQFNEGDATTNVLSGSSRTFKAGSGSEDGLASTVSAMSNEHTEVEYAVQIVSADVSNGNTVQLRVSNGGSALNTYTQTPSLTVLKFTAVVLTATPSLPAARLDHSLTAQVLTATVSMPQATLSEGQQAEAVVLTASPSLPQARLDHELTAAVLTVTPSTPQARIDLDATAQVLTATPSLPAARIDHELAAVVLEAAPSTPQATVQASGTNRVIVTWVEFSLPLPAGGAQNVTAIVHTVSVALPAARVDHEITAVVLAASPSLPQASLEHSLTAQVLTATPSLPQARLDHELTAIVLSVTPTLPQADVGHSLTAVVLSVTPTLPQASVDHSLTAQVLTATPSLPPASVVEEGQLAAVPLEVTPSYPQARIDHAVTANVLLITPDLPAAEVGILIESEPSGGYDRRYPPPKKRKPEKLDLPPLDWEVQHLTVWAYPVLPPAHLEVEELPPVPPDPFVLLMRELEIVERDIRDMEALWHLL